MKKALKKAFTIVELLVVIAIVAVLTVAGVVTYSAFTKKAELSNDISAVTQFNTLMQGLTVDGTPASMQEAVEALRQDGIDIDHFQLASESHRLGFDASTGKFLLFDGDKVIFPENYEGNPNNMYALDTSEYVLPNAGANTGLGEKKEAARKVQEYLTEKLKEGNTSHYLPEDVAAALDERVKDATVSNRYDVTSSLDATALTSRIFYADTAEEEVTFRLGSNGGKNTYTESLLPSGGIPDPGLLSASLSIDNPNATVNHYGYVKSVTIQNVKEYRCYAERWLHGAATISISGSGKIVLEKGYACDRGWEWTNAGRDSKTYDNTTNIAILGNSNTELRKIEIDFNDPLVSPYKGYTGFSGDGSHKLVVSFTDSGTDDNQRANFGIPARGTQTNLKTVDIVLCPKNRLVQ